VRLIALLLAVMMMTGATAPAVGATDAISAVDDAQDHDAPLLPAPIAVVTPERRALGFLARSAPERGRLHAVRVFRPPRARA